MLTFEELRTKNALRCECGFRHKLTDWSPSQWTNAINGEVGELCSLVKDKFDRGEDMLALRGRPMPTITQISDEIADVLIYLDLLAASLKISLDEAVRSKFNRTSEKIGSPIRLQ